MGLSPAPSRLTRTSRALSNWGSSVLNRGVRVRFAVGGSVLAAGFFLWAAVFHSRRRSYFLFFNFLFFNFLYGGSLSPKN